MAAKVWLNGTLVDASQAKVSVWDKGVLYGDGCFEGIRVYNHRIFKLQSHLNRMYESAEALQIKPPIDKKNLEAAIRETVSANDLKDGYVRPVFTRGVGTLGLSPKGCKNPTVFVIADKIKLYPQDCYLQGMPIVVANRCRVDSRALDPQVKSCNYLNNILAKQEAIDRGFSEALMLNTEGYVAECTGDNIFLFKEGHLITPDLSSGILNGITRQFVINDLAPSLGLLVKESLVSLDDAYFSDEIFLTGTAAEIIGVSRINDRVIGKGQVGPVTKKFTKAFRAKVLFNAPED